MSETARPDTPTPDTTTLRRGLIGRYLRGIVDEALVPVVGRLGYIEHLLRRVLTLEREIMSTGADLTAAVDTIKTAVGRLVTDFESAGHTVDPDTQAAIDSAVAGLDALAAAIDTADPTPTPEPEPADGGTPTV